MSISIHDRVRIIKNEQELDTSGADGGAVPPHGETHVKTGSDPVPPEIDGVTVDMTGLGDGQVPVYNLASGKFIPGSTAGAVTLEQARTAGDQFGGNVDYNDNEIVDIKQINFKDGEALRWNATDNTIDVVTGVGSTVIQVGMELVFPVYNATAVDIPDGSVIYPTGAMTSNMSNVEMAMANTHETISVAYGVATGLIAAGTSGLVCVAGKVRNINTIALDLGPVYISDTVAGGLTSTPPSFPSYSMLVGLCTVKSATVGEIVVDRGGDPKDTVINAWNGTFRESFDFRTSSDGTVVTGSLEPSNGHPDMTMIFSDGFDTLDTSPAATIALTPGTDTNPQTNYVYVPQSTKVLTVSTSGWPTTVEHIRVARIVLKSAATTQTEGTLGNQNWNDHVEDTTTFQGHMSHIGAKLRQFEAQWDSGIEGSSDITTNVVTLQNTAGYVFQLHQQAFPNKDTRQYVINSVSIPGKTFVLTSAVDLTSTYPVGKILKVNGSTGNDGIYTVAGTSWSTPNFTVVVEETPPSAVADGTVGDDASVVNDSVTPFANVSDLTDITLDASGNSLNDTSFALVVWGVANKTGEVSHLMINLPTDTYNKNFPVFAESDASNYSVYDIPKQFQGVGFLIARHIYVNSTGTWTLYATEDLRGKVPNTTAGGGGGGTGVTTFLGLTDTDSSYSGQAGSVPAVNSGESALEFVDPKDMEYVDLETSLPNPAEEEGRVFYDDDTKSIAYYNDLTGVTVLLGRESRVRALNDTGETIDAGRSVYVVDASSENPSIALATADDTDRDNVLAIAKDGVDDGDEGEFLRFGLVEGINTLNCEEGDTLYLRPGDEGKEGFVDGNMEMAGTANFTALVSAALSKSTADPYGGTQALRVTWGSAYSYAIQYGITVADKWYHITGKARGDGTAIPLITQRTSGLRLFTGTSSASWQDVDVYYYSGPDDAIGLGHFAGTGGWVEFDNFSCIELVDTVIDGDMELVGVTNWPAGNSATVTKSTVSPYAGAQSLRVTENGADDPYTSQPTVTPLVPGETYCVKGAFRGDGTYAPSVYDSGGALLAAGTSSTAWQTFEAEFVATGTTLYFQSAAVNGSSGWAEFDDIAVLSVVPDYGAFTNIKPSYPDKAVQVGHCTEVSATVGAVLVTIKDVQSDIILDDLVDVDTTSPADNDCLEYNGSTGFWENVDGVNAVRFQDVDIEDFETLKDKLGPQLMVDSTCEDSGTTDWTAGGSATLAKVTNTVPPGGGSQSLRITYNSVASPSASQAVLTVGKRYLLSFWARGDGTNGGTFLDGTTSLGTTTTGVAWLPYAADFVATGTSLYFQAADVSGADIWIDNVNLWEVREDEPVDGEYYRESYRQNLLTYSEHFTGSTSDWNENKCTINENSGVLSSLIDRETNLPVEMQAIVCTSAAGVGAHFIRPLLALTGLTIGGDYVLSMILKAGTYDFAYIRTLYGAFDGIYIDLSDGSIGGNTTKDYSITRLKGGDLLVEIVFDVTTTVFDFALYVGNTISNVNFVGDDLDGIYLTGMSFREGSLADNLPYTKTTTAAESGTQEFLLETETIKESQAKRGVLERIVNNKPSGIFETPKNDVLYVAPDHMQHQGNGNLVYAQVIFGDNVSGDVTANIASDTELERLIDVAGGCNYRGGNEWYAVGSYISASYYAQAKASEAGVLTVARGSSMNTVYDFFNVVFYFTLQENPDYTQKAVV